MRLRAAMVEVVEASSSSSASSRPRHGGRRRSCGAAMRRPGREPMANGAWRILRARMATLFAVVAQAAPVLHEEQGKMGL